MKALVEAAAARGLILATAESCTGGLVAAAITDTPGSSEVFHSGVVTYSNAAKVEMLGVGAATLKRFGAVSEEVAEEMARGAFHWGDVAVAITGIAGPGGSEHKPEGRVCFAIATEEGTRSETVEFGALGRDGVRAAARDHALKLLLDTVQSLPEK